MSDYLSNTDLRTIAEKIREASSILITTHSKPDGDALGSAIALADALAAMNKNYELWLMGPIADSLEFLFEGHPVHLVSEDSMPASPCDLHIIVDTGAWGQVADLQPFLSQYPERTIVIDHHSLAT